MHENTQLEPKTVSYIYDFPQRPRRKAGDKCECTCKPVLKPG